jgi:hypothetical protein
VSLEKNIKKEGSLREISPTGLRNAALQDPRLYFLINIILAILSLINT